MSNVKVKTKGLIEMPEIRKPKVQEIYEDPKSRISEIRLEEFKMFQYSDLKINSEKKRSLY